MAAALKFCHEAQELTSKLKEPQRSQVRSKIEIQAATLLYRQGRILEAEETFQQGFSDAQVAGCYPEMKPARTVWGDLCTDQGRYAEAEQHYRLALHGEEMAGNVAGMIFVLQRLGDSLIRQDRREEAGEVIHRAIELETKVVHEQMTREGRDPGKHVVVSWSLPDLHFCREQYEEAKQIYREKVEFWEKSVTRPDNIDLGHLQMRLALCEARTGDREAALEMYTRAEHTFERDWGAGHPKTAAARDARAAGDRMRGVFAVVVLILCYVALVCWRIAGKLRIINGQLAAYRRGDYEAQLRIVEGFKKNGSETPEYLFFHGSACLQLGRLTEAERALRRSLSTDGNPATAALCQDELARVLMEQERWHEAEERFRDCIGQASGRSGGHRGLAELLLRRGGDDAAALASARLAVEMDRGVAAGPGKLGRESRDINVSESSAVLAWALARNRGQRTEVETLLDEAFALCSETNKPIRAELHFYAGQAYAALGNAEESRRHFRISAETDPVGNYGRLSQSISVGA